MDTRLARLSLSDFVDERLKLLLTRITKEWERCAVSTDPDAIHDFRVSLRRFSEALRLFKGLFPKAARSQVRSELRQAMRAAGRTRNVDIARQTFMLSDAVLTPGTSLFLDNERATAEAGFRAVLSVGLATQVSKRWEETLGLSAGSGQAGSIPATAATRAWNPAALVTTNARLHLPPLLSLYCQSGQKLAHDAVKPARLHPLRLTGKHLRYALEFFRPIYGRTIDGLLETLRETQTSLGEVSDATATLAWLKRQHLQEIPEAVHLRHYLERCAGKGTNRFVSYWHDHWGLPAFRERWISYLGRYAGQMPPAPRARLQEPELPGADGQQDLEPSPSDTIEIVA